MVGEVTGVVSGAMDEARLAPPQHVQPDSIETRRLGDNSCVMSQTSLTVQDPGVEPRIVGAESRSPR